MRGRSRRGLHSLPPLTRLRRPRRCVFRRCRGRVQRCRLACKDHAEGRGPGGTRGTSKRTRAVRATRAVTEADCGGRRQTSSARGISEQSPTRRESRRRLRRGKAPLQQHAAADHRRSSEGARDAKSGHRDYGHRDIVAMHSKNKRTNNEQSNKRTSHSSARPPLMSAARCSPCFRVSDPSCAFHRHVLIATQTIPLPRWWGEDRQQQQWQRVRWRSGRHEQQSNAVEGARGQDRPGNAAER